MTSKPPYTITEQAADYLAKIVEAATRLELGTGFGQDVRLRRENRVRTIHSSLAIEGNTLSPAEVRSVIEGKLVAGSQEDIKEVKNAYKAYDQIMGFDPYAIHDFLSAHRMMTEGLVAESGMFRTGDVGVFDGHEVVHMGARPQFVPDLVKELFDWAAKSVLHPVLKSAILHYEIETIHPFADGNGRMGRLWQTLILAKWNPIFAWIPMESVLYEKRQGYYDAIMAARKANDSSFFIEFTLLALYETIVAQLGQQHESSFGDDGEYVENDRKYVEKYVKKFAINPTQAMIIRLMTQNPGISAKNIAERMNLSSRGIQKNIGLLKSRGLVERIGAAKGGHWLVKSSVSSSQPLNHD